mgnify:CR=1 FL=1|tara:strand:- start:345 stop:767 length:423 start_codon:yes stop_codon:yes gene_type:complete
MKKNILVENMRRFNTKNLTEQDDDELSQRDLENQRKRIVSIKNRFEEIKRRTTDMSGFEEALLDLIQGNLDEPWEQGRQDIMSQILKMYPIAKTYSGWQGSLRDISSGIAQTFKHARDMKAGDTANYGYNFAARNGGKLP